MLSSPSYPVAREGVSDLGSAALCPLPAGCDARWQKASWRITMTLPGDFHAKLADRDGESIRHPYSLLNSQRVQRQTLHCPASIVAGAVDVVGAGWSGCRCVNRERGGTGGGAV